MTRSLSQPSPRPRSGLTTRGRLRLAVAAAAMLAGGLRGNAVAGDEHAPHARATGAVFAMTNDAAGNQVIAYARGADGTLRHDGTYDTHGLGTSRTRLSSQNSVVLTEDGSRLLVANVGSNQISVFAVHGAQLRLVDVVDSHGQTPNSIAVRGHLVYVLNNGGAGLGNIAAFFLHDSGRLSFVPGTIRTMSAAGSDPAQVAITPDGSALVITEKATNKIDTVPLGFFGLPGPVSVHDADGVTPFGIDFMRSGVFVVTNATAGIIGQASASSYRIEGPDHDQLRTISGSVGDSRSEVCWTIISKDERFVYVTNFGDGTISSYDLASDGRLTLRDPVAAVTSLDQLSIRDEELTADGRYLYAIDILAQKIFGWRVEDDGSLAFIGAVPGLNATVAGIAVR